KARLFKNMREGDTAVVNVDNEAARQVAQSLPFEALRVAAACKEPLAACVEGDELLVQLPSEQNPVTVCRRSDLSVRGEHYLTNALCAAAVALSAGCTADAIRTGVRSWRPVDHQLTEVAVINGVRYVDDSKATNPASAVADLNTVEGPVIVIAGGLTKGLRMRDFAEALARRARAAFLIGEGAGEIAADIAGRIPATLSGTLEEAVRAAHAVAEPGDTVILAPACASFDQFRGQAQRGERFAEAVRALGSGNKA
ncbi:MAG: Mur ligase family protein, partial [Armatimonadia bacterium]